jgi:glycosyltransferase involved in cell wall biosynthesis
MRPAALMGTVLSPSRPRIVSTLHYPRRRQWVAGVHMIDEGLPRTAVVRELLAESKRCDAIILDGSIGIRAGNPDLAAAALIARRRRRPGVVLAECNWKPGSSLDRLVRRAGMRLIDRAISIFCVVSSHEKEAFPRTWSIDPERVVFTPFYYTLSEEELAAGTSEGGGVFSGGNPMRDYGTLVDAVRDLDVAVTIATSRREVVGRNDLPATVSAGRIPHDEYVSRLRAANVVVIPLQPVTLRSGGEQTYLNAMALGKLVIVSDSPGARDYIEPGVSGILVPPADPAALRDAIDWALDPANRDEARRIGAAAREAALGRFGPDAWVDRLLELGERVAI